MAVYCDTLALRTERPIQLIDITARVRELVKRADVRNGVAVVSTQHTTSAIRVNEPCQHLVADITAYLEQLAPRRNVYQHDANPVDGRPNAHSHLLAWLMGASESIPVRQGEMLLGQWQSLFFVELDGPRSERTVTITVVGA